jgi:Ca-activated chloride channel family protein
VTGRGLWLLALAPLLSGAGLFQTRNADVEKGNAAMAAGKAEDALAHYDKAVAKLPAEPGVHFDRGAALYALSRFDEAAQEFLRATDSADVALKAEAFRGLGNAHFKKDKFKDAVEAYKRALALRPEDQAAKRNLELALLKKKEEEKKEKEKDKDKDKDDKDKQDDKDKKDDQSKKDDDKDKQDKDKKDDQDKQDKDKKDDQKQGQDEKDKKQQPQPKPAGEDKAQQLEALLKNLEGNPKDLEKERARLRAVRRGRPARDW